MKAKLTPEWRSISGFEGLYEVSNYGQVRSLDRVDSLGRLRIGKIRRQKFIGRGYLAVSLSKDGEEFYYLVHRLVAMTFIPNHDPDTLTQVGHWDNVKTNNYVGNLYHTTPKENMHHDGNLDRLNQRIIEERSKRVYGINVNNPDMVISFYNAREAEINGFNRGQIYQCCRETYKRAKKVHKGYVWGYSIESAQQHLKEARAYIDPKCRAIKGVNINNAYDVIHFKSIIDAKEKGFCPSSVGYCCRGKTKSKIYKGYKWEYAS